MKRIHIPNQGPDKTRLPTALAVGVHECKQAGAAELALITSVKDNLDSIVIGEFLGKEASKKLMKGNHMPIGEHGVSLSHYSVATVQNARTPSVGLAFYLSKRDIQKLDDLNFEILIYVPWLDKDGSIWAEKWDAITHGASDSNNTINLPPEVQKSLVALTACVNLSTGLGHPSDKDHAKRKFAALRSAGITWNACELEKWAVRNGWKAKDAAELSKLSAKYT